jgi:heavy metal efflux system protein
LIHAALHTVYKALIEGIVFVMIVLYLYLGNIRGALAVTIVLIVVPLGTFIVMRYYDLSANLMSLGGMAISLAMITDAAIIQVENVSRHLSEASEEDRRSVEGRVPIVTKGVAEVLGPSLFGELIIALTFVPILGLVGMEGKMFGPWPARS